MHVRHARSPSHPRGADQVRRPRPAPATTHRPPPATIGATLVSARSGPEYLALLDLASASLARRRVLDCPGGAASFAAELATAGVAAVAADPAYRLGPAELASHARAESARGNDHVREHPGGFAWDWFADPDDHLARRLEAVERFVADRAAVPGRYVAAALPALPFAAGAFDLAVSSHLLFVYDDRLDLDAHLAAVRELLRVAREVRVAPTASLAGGRSALLAPVVEELRAEGLAASLHRTAYRFQEGSDEMLVVRR